MALLLISRPGTANLQMRLTTFKTTLTPNLNAAIRVGGEMVADALASAAPIGKGEDANAQPSGMMEGDAPGPLHTAFFSQYLPGTWHASTRVYCTQPRKLWVVRNGRGAVFPLRKKALWWPGLPHPVAYAAPAAPNEFVEPILMNGVIALTASVRDAASEALSVINRA